MTTQKENYKNWHPEQFSDSVIVKKASVGRDYLEYHLSKISGHSKEKDFERFCKALLEQEVCPNLMTQTGPTGGGDSKVDTETYPVAEQLSESWLYGFADKACTERWAFAISAKADWSTKVKSDVEKIAKTIIDGRGYKKIFCISNQLISDKKRADVEDELREKYNIDVRIFGMDWLLDVALRNDTNRMITVQRLGLSESLVDEKKIGENDYRRLQELEKNEEDLRNVEKLKASEIVNAARKSTILSRELEVDEQAILSYLDRYNRLSKEYGSPLDQADALYESAWTVFWWYPSADRFYSYYKQFEDVVAKEKTTYLFEKLCTLWLCLYTLTANKSELAIDLDRHRRTIESTYDYLISDESKPYTILSAKNSMQLIRLARGDSVDDIVHDYLDIVQSSENSLEIDVETIAKIIQRIPFYQESKEYDHLFEVVVNRLSKEKHESEAARMNAIRGSQLAETDPYKALSYFSMAVLGFHNEANTELLIKTVFYMAMLFNKIGLYWAARNYYLYVVTYSINQYIKKGETTPFFAVAANQLKWIEFTLGRVVFSTEIHTIEMIAREVYPGTIPEDNNNYDALLAFPFFKTPYEKLCKLQKMPDYLEKKNLLLSAAACRYELGYYDEVLMDTFEENKQNVDDYMKMWANQPAWEQVRFEPWYGFEDNSILQSKIMGCTFSVCSSSDMFAIEFAATLLASLECFLGTGFHNEIFSRASRFDIEIHKNPKTGIPIEVEYSRENPTYMKIEISEYDDSDFQKSNETISSKLFDIITIVVSVILTSNEDFKKLKDMVENESVLARTEVFTNSLIYGFSTFGASFFAFDHVIKDCREERMIRGEKAVLYTDKQPLDAEEYKERSSIIYGTPPGFDSHQYKNDEIYMTGIINNPLWDISKWYGTYYAVNGSNPPILSLLFKKESGLKIFDEWIEKYGNEDADDVIGIRIIKGIDVEHPNWYRIGIGPNSLLSVLSKNRNQAVITPSRMQTMQPESNSLLELFESIQSKSGNFYICPGILQSENQQPELHLERRILKHTGSIKIQNAYEIDQSDVLAAMAIIGTDKPVIPHGYENCDLVMILNRIRNNKP